MKIGDASRHRRFADPARQRWYAYHRAVRFALRMMPPPLPETSDQDATASHTVSVDMYRSSAPAEVYDEVAAEVLFG